ncbi:MAG: DegT/DnrJ/EryC1/StrS family aminotransferase [Deltaproteobacteria bacterium]
MPAEIAPRQPVAPLPLDLPRLPVLGWETFSGPKASPVPSVLDAPHVRFTTSGRAAIAIALQALRIGTGDRVLAPTYHCPTMIAPIVAAGAVPVFFPIDSSGAARLDAVTERDFHRVRAVIAAHYFGIPQPMANLRAFCRERNIALIEDCAHSLFGMSDGRPVGQWGHYAVASLTKFFPVMDGGCLASVEGIPAMLATTPPSVGEQLKSLANAAEIGARHGRLKGINKVASGLLGGITWLRIAPKAVVQRRAAETSRNGDTSKWLADFEPASLANRAATWWTRWTVRHAHRARIVDGRRRNYEQLANLVADIPGVRALVPTLPDAAAPYVFPLFVEQPETLYQAVRASGIPVFRWDELWPTCPVIPGDIGRRWATHVFQLGCHQDLGPDDISRIAERLRLLVRRAGRSSRRRQPATVIPAQDPASLRRA